MVETAEDEKVKEIGDFTLIDKIKEPEKKKVARALPTWLAEPTHMSSDLKEQEDLKLEAFSFLDDRILFQLKSMKFTYLFPVQKHVIKEVLKDANGLERVYPPKDICVAAPTGSGKTLAYVLSILQVIRSQPAILFRAMVILPVAELAKQVAHVFKQFVKPFGIYVGEAYGAVSFEEEQAAMVRQVGKNYIPLNHIIVGTPGRIAMHAAQTKGLDFSHLRFLVLDEADHLLVGDWAETLQSIFGHIKDHKQQGCLYPSMPCQKLLFSATLMSNPEQLHVLNLYQPMLFVSSSVRQSISCATNEPIQANSVPERPQNLEEEYIVIESLELKVMALFDALQREKKLVKKLKAIVFANSKEVVRKLSVILKSMAQKSFVVAEFSSVIRNRKAVMAAFKNGKIDVIVATDAMARGVDITNINLIVSYEVTNGATYTHRVGRTARAGRSGKAISLVTKDELKAFKIFMGKGLKKATKLEVSASDLTQLEDKFETAMHGMAKQIQSDKKTGKAATYTTVKRNYSNLRKSLKALNS